MALTRALQKLGKQATPVCVDCAPYKYASLPGMGEIQRAESLKGFAQIIAVDCADKERIGSAARKAFPGDAFIINIDHHQSNTMFGDMNYVDATAASSAELVYRVMEELGISLDRELAEYLLVAVSTDTGHFSYRNTGGDTLRFAAKLLDAGADVQQMSNDVYKRRTEGMTRLIGRAIDSMTLHADGKVAIMRLTLKDFADCGADPADAEGLIDFARDIDSVEVAAILRESEKGVKISLRSEGSIDVASIAQTMGGGGHKAAAGLFIKASLGEAEARIKEMLTGAL